MKKLSEFNTLEGIKILGRLTTEFNKIASDIHFKEKCVEIAKNIGNMTAYEQFGKFADLILNDYPDMVINVISVLQDKKIEDINNQPFLKTYAQVQELFQDKDLVSFFTSFTKKGQKT